MDEAKLSSRLLRLMREANSIQRERGINVLHLALGFLEWYESPTSDKPMTSPLVLLPVTLKRVTPKASSFKLTLNDVELSTNGALRRRLSDDFRLELPEMNHNGDDLWTPTDYLYEVDEAIVDAGVDERWQVRDSIAVLSLFNFAKQRMYRDLAGLTDNDLKSKHPFIYDLLGEGTSDADPSYIGTDEPQDAKLPPSTTTHLLDADPSQARVIEEARRGRSLVVQGPPGTGKSQTIANIIATSLVAGRRVLLVAEKQVALQVVVEKLADAGIRDLCLELHSHRTERRSVYRDQFGAALRWHAERGHSFARGGDDVFVSASDTLISARDALSSISDTLHDPRSPGGYTLYQTLGMLMKLADTPRPPFDLDATVEWSNQQIRDVREQVQQWVETLQRIGSPTQHALRHVSNAQLSPPYQRTLERPMADVVNAAEKCDHQARDAVAVAKRAAKQLKRHNAKRFAVTSGVLAVSDAVASVQRSVVDVSESLSSHVRCERWNASPHQAIRVLQHLSAPPTRMLAAFAVACDVLDEIAGSTEFKSLRKHLPDLLTRLRGDRLFGRRRAVRHLRQVLGADEQTPVRDLIAPLRFLVATGDMRSADALPERAIRDVTQTDRQTQPPVAALDGLTAQGAWDDIRSWANDCVNVASDSSDPSNVPATTVKEALAAATLVTQNDGAWLRSVNDALELCRSSFASFGSTTLVDAPSFGAPEVKRINEAVEQLRVVAADCRAAHTKLLQHLSVPKSSGARKTERRLLSAEAIATTSRLLDDWRSITSATDAARAEFLDSIGIPEHADSPDMPAVLGAELDAVLPAKKRKRLAKALKRARRSASKANDTLASVAKHLGITAKTLVPAPTSAPTGMMTPKQRRRVLDAYSAMNEQYDSYDDWGRHLRQRHALDDLGLGALCDWACETLPSPQEAADLFERAVGEARLAAHCSPSVADLLRSDRTQMVKAFHIADDKHRDECKAAIFRRYVRDFPDRSSAGMRDLARLSGQTRPRKAVRTTLSDHPIEVQKVKPVFLMSPLSVSHYLQSDRIKFDTIIFDEASQVRPEDALPTLQRLAQGGQVIVVGDRQQLPPNTFFDRMTEDRDLDEAEPDDDNIYDDESILTLCDNQGSRSEGLLWHYRSRDPSLIAVSNREFYDNRLHLVPSPREDNDDLGLHFHQVTNGVYDGAKRNNPGEAQKIVEAACAHAQRYVASDSRPTLGIATFSQSQADLIESLLDAKRAADPFLNEFLRDDGSDEVFVKSIENVQGDERDVVLVSIGYAARNDNGELSLRFGPVNNAGGEKRLNVLFTRARLRCDVFCSFRPDEIDPQRARWEGVRILKEFLSFAQNRESTPVTTGGDYESPFEEDVASEIQRMGYEVVPQFGTHNFRIDLAVRHPSRPDEFMLAVEADGATYHRSLSARERDRLRQQVLESYGWRFHRIWSTDWFYDRTATVSKLRDALEDAARHTASPSPAGAPGGNGLPARETVSSNPT